MTAHTFNVSISTAETADETIDLSFDAIGSTEGLTDVTSYSMNAIVGTSGFQTLSEFKVTAGYNATTNKTVIHTSANPSSMGNMLIATIDGNYASSEQVITTAMTDQWPGSYVSTTRAAEIETSGHIYANARSR